MQMISFTYANDSSYLESDSIKHCCLSMVISDLEHVSNVGYILPGACFQQPPPPVIKSLIQHIALEAAWSEYS